MIYTLLRFNSRREINIVTYFYHAISILCHRFTFVQQLKSHVGRNRGFSRVIYLILTFSPSYITHNAAVAWHLLYIKSYLFVAYSALRPRRWNLRKKSCKETDGEAGSLCLRVCTYSSLQWNFPCKYYQCSIFRRKTSNSTISCIFTCYLVININIGNVQSIKCQMKE